MPQARPAPTLRFNDRTITCAPGLTVAAVLAQAGIEASRVATALNGEFVAREARASTALAPGDELLTFSAIEGG